MLESGCYGFVAFFDSRARSVAVVVVSVVRLILLACIWMLPTVFIIVVVGSPAPVGILNPIIVIGSIVIAKGGIVPQ